MMESFTTMRQRHTKELDDFSVGRMFYAFNTDQLKKGVETVGLTFDEATTGKQLVYAGNGACVRKDAMPALKELLDRQNEEEKENRKNKKNLKQAFFDALAATEYSVSMESDDALRYCGISRHELDNDLELKKTFNAACKEYLKKCWKK